MTGLERIQLYLKLYGPLKFGCGPSDTETALEHQAGTMASTLQQNYGTRFGQQTQEFNNLNNSLTPTLQAGPNQTGFNAQELAALNTQAINTTGANYKNAAQALNGQLAGRGGDSGLVSGVDQQIKAGLASESAGALSNEQLGITKANYDTGRQNYNNAVAGITTLAGLENPTAIAGAADNANSTAFSEANTIQEQANQEQADIIGGIAGIGMDAATFGAGAAGGGGFAGGLKALSNANR